VFEPSCRPVSPTKTIAIGIANLVTIGAAIRHLIERVRATTGRVGHQMTQRFRKLFCRALRRFVGTLLIAFAALPAEADNPSSARGGSAIVVDGNSGNVLYSAKSDELRHPASLTKIMTLYLLFERMEAGKFKLNSQLSVSRHASVQAPSKLELRPGQTITVEDAIRAMVTKSANDVAVVVAEAIGGSEGEFANMMTKKAHALGMSRTVYRNASGLPNEGQLTTARDQALLGRAIQERFPRQYRYFSTPSFTYNGETMSNHNHLLGQIEGIDGIKTGYTQASGFNLVTSVHRNKRYIVAVVLGGETAGARDTRMRALIEAHIATASTQHTARAITEIEVAKNQKPAAEAKTEDWPAKAAPNYTVASFAPQAGPAPQFVPFPAGGDVPPESALAIAPPTVAAAPFAKANRLPLAAESASPVEVQEAVTPVRVKTVKAKLAQTADLGPAIVQVPEDSAVLLRTPSPPSKSPGSKGTPLVPASGAPTVDKPSAEPPPPKAMVYAFRPATVPSAPAPVERQAAAGTSTIATRDAKRFEGSQSSASRAGWIVQIGAFDIEREAQQRLSSARAKVSDVLNHAQSFTEAVSKGEKTLYRARLAGFQQKEDAEAACKQLKQNDFDCIILKN
jgi:D-alanyl-D-alanine carboxypeptidase